MQRGHALRTSSPPSPANTWPARFIALIASGFPSPSRNVIPSSAPAYILLNPSGMTILSMLVSPSNTSACRMTFSPPSKETPLSYGHPERAPSFSLTMVSGMSRETIAVPSKAFEPIRRRDSPRSIEDSDMHLWKA